ncbi:DNA repair protein rhp54 [Hordeum vulgare]|nr:DNA repair protein rhp54 [Hordeum vulgare]
MAGGSSSGGMRKHQREMPADVLTGARKLFDGMPVVLDDDTSNCFFENMIFEGGALYAGAYSTAAYDPDETQSQDGRVPFMQATNDPHDAFMHDQVGLNGFPLYHEFPADYVLEEEDDDMEINGEPLFKEELINQTAVGPKLKCKSKRTKAYTLAEDKILCECWRDIGQDPKVSAKQKWVIQQGCNKFSTTYESIKERPVSMKTSLEIMKVNVNTMSPRKRLWFKKMQAEMLKFDQL